MTSGTGKKGSLIQVAVAGSVIVAAILIIGTILIGRSASRDTEKAVRSVSLLYLGELAGRREQVVSSTLEGYISDMDVAIGLLDKEDLSSTEKLQSYQARMKQLYGLDKFAFVDEEGMIYTSHGTRTDIDQYSFDHTALYEPEISIKNAEDGNKKVIIAEPVDRLSYEGHILVVCFMEIDMDRFLNSLSLQTDNTNTTFCNIYTSDGNPLTNNVLGGYANETNLLEAMERAEFEEGYSLENVRSDLAECREGVVSFTYNGIQETLYYVPIHSTDWMLTYLIRESVISGQIETISNGIIMRSLVQSVLTAIVLFAFFMVVILQARKAAKLEAERETAEVMQQELEERIALQDELLTQEKKRAQQDSMITALASDYRSVYYIDLDNNDGVCYRKGDKFDESISEGSHFNFMEKFTGYAYKYVTEDFRDAFLKFISPESIKEGLKKENLITLRYLVRHDEEETYEMLRMAGVRHPDDRDDDSVHAVGAGFTDIDDEMRDTMAMNQTLSDALKTAEEASRAKTAFLSNMSHEIRTPMNAIIGLDNLALHEEGVPESVRDYLEKIGSSAQHLLNLINDILDMSRIESGKMVIRNEEFSFPGLIEQINTIFSGQCREKGLTYSCNINKDLKERYIGDSVKLRQVLINILGNAVKFTPSGGKVELVVDKTAEFDGKTALRFEIRDNGIGMSKDYLPRLFETFSQEDATTVNKYGSSGLGMAITKSFVDMMNGRIEVESEKGKGTTFTVTVTLVNSGNTARSDEASAKNDGADSKIQADLSGTKVLLAEDMTVNAQIMLKVLKMRDIETELAENGSIAVEMFSSHPEGYYDAILMDVRMPVMDGLEAAATIRAMSRPDAKSIPIIALTANAFAEDVQRSLQAGMNAHLSKPVQPDALFDTLGGLIK